MIQNPTVCSLINGCNSEGGCRPSLSTQNLTQECPFSPESSICRSYDLCQNGQVDLIPFFFKKKKNLNF